MGVSDDSLDLPSLLASWLRRLKSEHKSPHTLKGYRAAVGGFIAFCDSAQIPAELNRDTVTAYLDAHPGQVSTARLHLTVLKLFARWLADEEGFDPSSVLAVKPPKGDQRVVPNLSETDLSRLMKACGGNTLRDRRDYALVVLLTETGLRASEMVALDITDVNLDECALHVQRGKGGKGRWVHFSLGASAAVDRYIRARHRVVRHPASGPLWISRRGDRLSYAGLAAALKDRAEDAGIDGFFIHKLRHTMATRWLRAGGSEVGLMAHAGWSSNTMISRYVKAASEQLAGEEFNRLGLGVVDL
jgi:integrase/recombinase XerD